MRRIGYKNHNLGTYETNKRSLSHIPGHPYEILIISGSGSGKANTLLN